jgi:hypothetical protein
MTVVEVKIKSKSERIVQWHENMVLSCHSLFTMKPMHLYGKLSGLFSASRFPEMHFSDKINIKS